MYLWRNESFKIGNLNGRIQELMSRSIQLHSIPVTAFLWPNLFLDRISLERDSRGSAMTNHVTGPELPFVHKSKGLHKNAVTLA